jgi:hypothetical protein
MFSALTGEAWATAMMVAMETMTAMTEREARLPCDGVETNKDSTDCSDIKTGEDLGGSVSERSTSPSLPRSLSAVWPHSAILLLFLCA